MFFKYFYISHYLLYFFSFFLLLPQRCRNIYFCSREILSLRHYFSLLEDHLKSRFSTIKPRPSPKPRPKHSSTKGNFSFLKAIVEKIAHDGSAACVFIAFYFSWIPVTISSSSSSSLSLYLSRFCSNRLTSIYQSSQTRTEKIKTWLTYSIADTKNFFNSNNNFSIAQEAKNVQLLFIIYCYIFITSKPFEQTSFLSLSHCPPLCWL